MACAGGVVYHPPEEPLGNSYDRIVFLCGSSGGARSVWQEVFSEARFGVRVAVLDPRRRAWEGNGAPSAEALEEQVRWEQRWMSEADVVVVNNTAGGMSPARMVQLGQCVERRPEAVVLCAAEAWPWERHMREFAEQKSLWQTGSLLEMVGEVVRRCGGLPTASSQ